MKGTTRHLVID